MKKVNLIDYGMGNLRSVGKALEKAGAEVVLVSQPDEFEEKGAVVLPGVGAFYRGMRNLEERNLVPVILKAIEDKKPFLGICLGLQILFTESDEHGIHKGLDFIKGRVRKFEGGVKIPHMGWNQIKIKEAENFKLQIKKSPGQLSEARKWQGKENNSEFRNPKLFEGVSDDSYFYFVHSYFVEPEDKNVVLATTEYGREFVSAVARGNAVGVQFHPEKSSDIGIRFLKNFLSMV